MYILNSYQNFSYFPYLIIFKILKSKEEHKTWNRVSNNYLERFPSQIKKCPCNQKDKVIPKFANL